jgi:hypothetical protein
MGRHVGAALFLKELAKLWRIREELVKIVSQPNIQRHQQAVEHLNVYADAFGVFLQALKGCEF